MMYTKADFERMDRNWERRLRRALSKKGYSLHKSRIATDSYMGIIYKIRDAQTGDEYEQGFTSLGKLQTWYESRFL